MFWQQAVSYLCQRHKVGRQGHYLPNLPPTFPQLTFTTDSFPHNQGSYQIKLFRDLFKVSLYQNLKTPERRKNSKTLCDSLLKQNNLLVSMVLGQNTLSKCKTNTKHKHIKHKHTKHKHKRILKSIRKLTYWSPFCKITQ